MALRFRIHHRPKPPVQRCILQHNDMHYAQLNAPGQPAEGHELRWQALQSSAPWLQKQTNSLKYRILDPSCTYVDHLWNLHALSYIWYNDRPLRSLFLAGVCGLLGARDSAEAICSRLTQGN